MDKLSVSGLPARQGQALFWRAVGKTNKEIAKIMGCSPDNIAQLIQAVLYKLHARNTPEAITKAFERGILKFVCFALVLCGAGLSISQPVIASDDDPLARRIRGHRARRASRKVSRGFFPPSNFNQLYIEYFNLEPVLAWDDGEMHVHYQPTSPLQFGPFAQVFNLDDLMRWHSDQFYQSLNGSTGGPDGQASDDQPGSKNPVGATVKASPGAAQPEGN